MEQNFYLKDHEVRAKLRSIQDIDNAFTDFLSIDSRNLKYEDFAKDILTN